MPLDLSIRSTGIGASEVAGILGMDPRQTPFELWARKTGQLSPKPMTPRMAMGKKIERFISELYEAETGRPTRWCGDITFRHPRREWQLYTPDAVCEADTPDDDATPLGVECKNVAFDQAHLWGYAETDEMPTRVLCQCHWSMSATGWKRWDVCAFFGGNVLRIYTVLKDPDLEAVLLTEAEKWWQRHIVEGVMPDIGAGEGARRYLRERFPKNNGVMREATAEEVELLNITAGVRKAFSAIEKDKETYENRVKLAIGDAEGLTWPGGRVTYRECAGSTYTVTREPGRRIDFREKKGAKA